MGTYVRTQTIEHAIGAHGELELNVVDSDVRLRASSGDTARLRITFEIRADSEAAADQVLSEIQFIAVPEAGRLTVRQHENAIGGFSSALSRLFGGRGEGHLGASVEGEAPAGAHLSIQGVSADMDAKGFHGEQRYQTVSGDLLIAEASGSVVLNSVSGDTSLRADGPVEVRVDTVSGDVRVTTPRLRGLRSNSVSGDVEFEAALDPGDYRIQTVSGDVRVGLTGAAVFEVRGMATDIDSDIPHRIEGHADRQRLIIGEGGPSVVFSTMSGDLSVRRPRSIPAAAPDASASAATQSSLDILKALEAGEIDVDEAARRLEAS